MIATIFIAVSCNALQSLRWEFAECSPIISCEVTEIGKAAIVSYAGDGCPRGCVLKGSPSPFETDLLYEGHRRGSDRCEMLMDTPGAYVVLHGYFADRHRFIPVSLDVSEDLPDSSWRPIRLRPVFDFGDVDRGTDQIRDRSIGLGYHCGHSPHPSDFSGRLNDPILVRQSSAGNCSTDVRFHGFAVVRMNASKEFVYRGLRRALGEAEHCLVSR